MTNQTPLSLEQKIATALGDTNASSTAIGDLLVAVSHAITAADAAAAKARDEVLDPIICRMCRKHVSGWKTRPSRPIALGLCCQDCNRG
jgi:hypothetical protein